MPKRCYGCMKLKEKSPVCEHCGYNENVPNEPHQLPTGTVLQGRYQIGKVLGQGGFGITYIGWDMSLETAVAIKEYYPGSIVNRDCGQDLTVSCNGSNVTGLFEGNRDRFLREARILAMLSHVPGIVRVQNLFEANNTAYIVMEYVEGIDLKRYIRMQGRVLTVGETFAVLGPVMYALSKVHDAGLVHRDISPDNIMIQNDGSVVLLDFGAARQVENADVHKDLTQSTQTILKHGFAPMEQYRSRGNLGPWTDVYALCATMYYCLTGKVPSEAPERVMGDDNVDWKQIPGLNDKQIDVLEKGMALLPEKRISSMKELWNGLFDQTETKQTAQHTRQTEEKAVEKPADYPTHTVPLEKEEAPEAPKPKNAPISPTFGHSKRQKQKVKFAVVFAMVILTASIAASIFLHKPQDGLVEQGGHTYYYQDGKRMTGWHTIDGKKYYFNSDGIQEKRTGWQTIEGKKYYFSTSGQVKIGWQTINGKKYYFSDDGIMQTGWLTIGLKQYYLDSDGVMQTGWQTIYGKKYFFSDSGVLQ